MSSVHDGKFVSIKTNVGSANKKQNTLMFFKGLGLSKCGKSFSAAEAWIRGYGSSNSTVAGSMCGKIVYLEGRLKIP